ncbi:J domain-containing protein [Enterovibrio paralichthyis]|uniref:J domain-containing protein n=1 Tax=Enterovibrio paralichthyis TaxID=2853805 RepID=UPI001C469D2A|nr:J domain-containing protein [Enterovibrio paralichthyis]MBV7299679.1 J domain-containing protein [Enterovibrio paralichthyis]
MLNVCIIYLPSIPDNEDNKTLFLGYLASHIGNNLRDFEFVQVIINYSSNEIIIKLDLDDPSDLEDELLVINEDIWDWSCSVFEWETISVDSKIFVYENEKLVFKSEFEETYHPDKELNDSQWNKEEKLINMLDKANLTIRSANIRINQLKESNSLLSSLKFDFEQRNLTIKNLRKEIESLKNQNSITNCPHTMLGVKKCATKTEIKANYFKLSNIYHPDRSGDNTLMKEINAAYNKIK